MPLPSTLYLLAYNALQAIGWSLSLSRILSSCLSAKSTDGAYAAAGDLICLLQTTAFLEVIHSAIGLVPSGVVPTLMQWGGRTHFLLAIVLKIVEVQELPSVFITFIAWSISEMIRYSHYALNCIGMCPSWLTYLRYTAFIPLYPLGLFAGEMWLMYQGLPFIKEKRLYASVLDRFAFSYYSFVKILLVCYPFLWLKLYLHLFKQRCLKLGRDHQKKH